MRAVPIHLPAMLANVKDLYILQYLQRDLVNLYPHLISRRTRRDIDGIHGQTPRTMLAIREMVVWIPIGYDVVVRIVIVIHGDARLIRQHSIIVFSYDFHEAVELKEIKTLMSP